MKRIAILLLTAAALLGAPGQSRQYYRLVWDSSPAEEFVTAYYLYHRTDAPPGMPLTGAAPGSTTWTPTETNGWAIWAAIPAPATNFLAVALNPQPHFWVVTASNWMGESLFSNVAWSPKSPPGQRAIKIE